MGSGKGKSRRAQAVTAAPPVNSESKAKATFQRATSPARKTYKAAIDQAQKKYNEDLIKMWKIRRASEEQAKALYDKVTKKMAAYKKAVAPIDEELKRAIDQAEQKHNEEQARAIQEHNNKIAKPWTSPEEALLPPDHRAQVARREKIARRYNATCSKAMKTAREARSLEWDKYQKDTAPEWKALESARKQAKKTLSESTEKVEATLAQAKAEATEKYKQATAPAWAAYQSAISSAKK